MKVKINPKANVQLEFDVDSPKDLIKAFSDYGELFSEPVCRKCNSERVRYEHRVAQGNDFYSLRCLACNAQLDFGQHKIGDTLFVRRDRGQGGWYHWDGQKSLPPAKQGEDTSGWS